MYIPEHFQQANQVELRRLISDHPFATLVCAAGETLEACHIPMHLHQEPDGQAVLRGHIAKANPLWQQIPDNSTALAIFQGPHAYVSPNHYPTKHEHGRAVPTWNYLVVHARGPILFKHEDDWKLSLLNSLTDHMEAGLTAPWQVSDAPQTYIDRQLVGIVGIEIALESLQGQWKLSQNQPAINRDGVIKGLSESQDADAQAVAGRMAVEKK